MSELRSILLAIELATRKRDELAKAAARVEKTLQFAHGQMQQRDEERFWQQLLLQAEYRLAGLNQVLKARQTAVVLKERRSEQRQTDEFAAMLYARQTRTFKTGELP